MGLPDNFKVVVFAALLLMVFACKKSEEPEPEPEVPVIDTPNAVPHLAFGGWSPRNAVIPATSGEEARSTEAVTARITIDFAKQITKVSPYVYGNNANCYTGWMQNNSSLMRNITNLKMGVMRIPGGSLSDVFFWDRKAVYTNYTQTGMEPALTDIPSTISPWVGRRSESFEEWSMGVDQYYQMMQQAGLTGMVTVNYGYARYGTSSDPVGQAARYAAEWVRHDNGKSKFWEIGNEVFGSWEAGYEIDQTLNKDGQPKRITGDLYGKHALVFIDSMKKAAREIGKEIHIGVVCAEESNSAMANWNKELIARVGDKVDFYIIHSYFTPYQTNSAASVILNSPQKLAGYKSYIENELKAQNKPVKPILLTEWNIFAEGSKQAVSNINGMHAALILGELIKNKYEVAVRWDLANGWNNGNDHGLFSTGDEPGVTKYAPRPSFFYQYYFQKYFGDIMVEASTAASNVAVYASRFSGSGDGGIVLVNKGTTKQVVELSLKNFFPGNRYYTYTLNGGSDNGDFSRKVFVNGSTTTEEGGGPSNYESLKARSSVIEGNIRVELPKYSVVYLLAEEK